MSRRFSISAAAPARPARPGRSRAAAARSTASISIRGRSPKRTGRIASLGSADTRDRATSIARADSRPQGARNPGGVFSQRDRRRHPVEPRWPGCRRDTNRARTSSIIEPIAKRLSPGGHEWAGPIHGRAAAGPTSGVSASSFRNVSGFSAAAAGLDPRELTARSLWM